MSAADLLIWGIVAHLIADWIFQSEWQAINKTNLRHPAAWTHGGIHLLALLFVFPASLAAAVALLHVVIDTRVPLEWWRRRYKQTNNGPNASHVAIWTDQVAHIAVIALAAWLAGV